MMTRTPTVIRQPSLAQVVPGMLPAGSYTMEQLEHLATVCHKSGLFEDVVDAAQAFMKILKGTEMGLPVTTSMQAFDIIKKRLFIKPFAIAALINSCGYGSYHVMEQTAEVCTIHFARKYPGQGWLDCPPVSYTIQEARAHGLIDRSPHWKASPHAMLYQRAMGRGGAMYFPELLAGLQPPQDDTPITPEQHAQNMYDVYGVEPETVASGTRGGLSVIQAIEALHQAYGKDAAWLLDWWGKICRERGIPDHQQLPVPVLTDLLARMRRYYQGEVSTTSTDIEASGAPEEIPQVEAE